MNKVLRIGLFSTLLLLSSQAFASEDGCYEEFELGVEFGLAVGDFQLGLDDVPGCTDETKPGQGRQGRCEAHKVYHNDSDGNPRFCEWQCRPASSRGCARGRSCTLVVQTRDETTRRSCVCLENMEVIEEDVVAGELIAIE